MLGLLGRNVLQLRMLGPLKQMSLTARLLSTSSEGDSSEQISSKHIKKIHGDSPASSIQKVVNLLSKLHLVHALKIRMLVSSYWYRVQKQKFVGGYGTVRWYWALKSSISLSIKSAKSLIHKGVYFSRCWFVEINLILWSRHGSVSRL